MFCENAAGNNALGNLSSVMGHGVLTFEDAFPAAYTETSMRQLEQNWSSRSADENPHNETHLKGKRSPASVPYQPLTMHNESLSGF